jgi:hypothetical protein
MPQSTRFPISYCSFRHSQLLELLFTYLIHSLFAPLLGSTTFQFPYFLFGRQLLPQKKRIWADVVSCSRRRCFTKRNPEAQTTEVDKTYQELDLTKINTENINYQSLRNRKLQRNSEPQTAVVDTTYNELDLSKMNTADDYQSLRVSAAIVNTYTV